MNIEKNLFHYKRAKQKIKKNLNHNFKKIIWFCILLKMRIKINASHIHLIFNCLIHNFKKPL